MGCLGNIHACHQSPGQEGIHRFHLALPSRGEGHWVNHLSGTELFHVHLLDSSGLSAICLTQCLCFLQDVHCRGIDVITEATDSTHPQLEQVLSTHQGTKGLSKRHGRSVGSCSLVVAQHNHCHYCDDLAKDGVAEYLGGYTCNDGTQDHASDGIGDGAHQGDYCGRCTSTHNGCAYCGISA